MALPNPGMDAVPFTPLTAEFLDDMIENIESLSDGTGFENGAITTNTLAESAVTASKIANSAIFLGYAERTSNASTPSATPTAVGLSVTVNVPAGGRRVKVTVFGEEFLNTNLNGYAIVTLFDGPVGGTIISQAVMRSAVAAQSIPLMCMSVKASSPGTKTYSVGLSQSNGGTAQITASSTWPAGLLVELV